MKKLIEELGTEDRPFGEHEEESIISLALEEPEFYTSVIKYISSSYFKKFSTQIVHLIIEKYVKKYGIIPTRQLLKDKVLKQLTADDDYEPIIALIEKRPSPRETPIIKDTIIEWAKYKAYGEIFDQNGIEAYSNKDYERLEKLFEEARRISDTKATGGIDFFNQTNLLFEEHLEEKLTCGFPKLDIWLNDGGPTRGEVVVFMAPTGVGKSLCMINSAVACLRRGLKVLHITCEMSEKKTMLRYGGVVSGIKIKDRKKKQKDVEERIEKFKATYANTSLKIYEYPPDEISVDQIYQLMDDLAKLHEWRPDVVVIDYLELLMSKNAADNKEEYTRQKRVSTQIRGLAKKSNVLVFSGTQTNRSDTGKNSKGPVSNAPLDINKIAESFGKAMPLDYLISLNQTPEQYKTGKIVLFIAKNRNGAKAMSVTTTVDYDTMLMLEDGIAKL